MKKLVGKIIKQQHKNRNITLNIFDKTMPKFIHNLFNKYKEFGFTKLKTKKITDKIKNIIEILNEYEK